MASLVNIVSTVGIKELKNRLPHYLRQTRRGEEIVVTDRGKPIAILHSIEAGYAARSREAKLGHLAARGAVVLPTRKPSRKVRMVRVSGEAMSTTIAQDRR